MLGEIGIILLLVVANGIFAGTELAVVSARNGRLQELATNGNQGAAAALRLREDPNRFLSAVQVGITLIGTLAGAFGGASLAARLDSVLETIPFLAPYADTLALALVVLGITYLSLVIGELVPKRLALQSAETIAVIMSRPMTLLATISRPIIFLLSWSTELVLALIGRRNVPESIVTEEDIRHLVREGAQEGSVDPQEEQVIEGVFNLSDRTVRQIMTPRVDVQAVAADARLGDVLDKLIESGYSRFPAYEGGGDLDDVVGVVHVRDLLQLYRTQGEDAKVRAAMFPPTLVPEQARAASLLNIFRRSQRHLAIVVSELGSVEGIVTLEDVIEEIVGDILDEHDVIEQQAITVREDGSLLIDGAISIDIVKQRLHVDELPEEEFYQFNTLAGFVLSLLGRIPKAGDSIIWDGWSFEVVDMDGLRIDKVLVQREKESAQQSGSEQMSKGFQ